MKIMSFGPEPRGKKKKKRIIRGKNGNSDRGNTGDPECLHFKWSWHFLVKEFLGSLVLIQERHHTQRAQWATKAPWSLIFTPLASSVHTGVLMVLFCSALRLVDPSHIVPTVDNLKGTRFSNPWLWWKEAKKTKHANIDGLTQHVQSLLGASVLSAALSDLEWNIQ